MAEAHLLNPKITKMYAIVEIQGNQFKVKKNSSIVVNRMAVEEGESVEFDRILLVDNDGEVKVGKPMLEGAKVTASVVKHLRGEKVIVFKKKRRKGHQKKNGHRQDLTQLQIEGIEVN